MTEKSENNGENRLDSEMSVTDQEADSTTSTALAQEADDTIVEPDDALPEVSLAELPESIQSAAAGIGWSKLMPVQAKAIPYMLAGRDLMVQSRTGSGKTGAFILPILDRIDPKKKHCQALVLVPTRELAQQVSKEAEILGSAVGVHSAAVYGGVKYGPQLDALRSGAQLIIGTPGRILDHLLRRNMKLDRLEVLVFDEADRMLSMGFYPDMREVKSYLPDRRINAYMFSATFPSNVLRLSREFLHAPEFLSLSKDRVHVAEAEHLFYLTPAVKRDRSLIRLIEIENPASAIIFCNTKKTVRYVTIVLQRFGYDADELSSDLDQKARQRVLDRVRAGQLRFLVATDVAARGIDIPELSHVFQYEPPEDPESYIHRAGRTARAGATGVAITMIADFSERVQLKSIAKRYDIEMKELPLPTDEDVTVCVSERVTTILEAQLRTRDNLKSERMRRFLPLVEDWTRSEEGQALLAMLVDDVYQESLHAPQTPPLAEEPAPPPKPAEPEPQEKSDRPRRRRRPRRGRKRDEASKSGA